MASGQNDGRGGNPPLLPPLHKGGYLVPDRRGRRPRRPAPSCQSTERSERRDLLTDLLVQEISPLGRCRFLGRNDRENPCLHRLAKPNGGGGIFALAKMTEGATPLLECSRGGGILASGQNAGRVFPLANQAARSLKKACPFHQRRLSFLNKNAINVHFLVDRM